jgi:hypothetical protein
MENPITPRIVSAERLGGGIIITFEDGKSALYPAALMYSMFHQAERLDELEWSDQN